jgi:hypothetical protein
MGSDYHLACEHAGKAGKAGKRNRLIKKVLTSHVIKIFVFNTKFPRSGLFFFLILFGFFFFCVKNSKEIQTPKKLIKKN